MYAIAHAHAQSVAHNNNEQFNDFAARFGPDCAQVHTADDISAVCFCPFRHSHKQSVLLLILRDYLHDAIAGRAGELCDQANKKTLHG